MGKIKTHYNMDKIDSLGANINIIFAERSNGKSYQVKHKKGVCKYLEDTPRYIDSYKNKGNIIKEVLKKGTKFMLIRRWREEIETNLIEKYFDDVDIEKLTNGKYDIISVYRKEIYLSNYDTKTNKVIKGEKIGYVVALSTEQKYAGGSYLDVTDMIFEEFMSRGLYLSNEPAKLMNLYSTVDRKRGYVKLWLVGNTITRVCPYLKDWGLLDMIRNMKQGDIKVKWEKTGDKDDDGIDIEVKIAFEWCFQTGDSSFIIGSHKEMLNKGEWQVDTQPKLSDSRKNYKLLYRILFVYKGFKFLGEYLMHIDSKQTCWFIKPYSKDIKSNIMVFSDVIKESKYYQRDIYNPLIKNIKLVRLLQTFRENNIFYANDLCGTEFKQAIDFEIRK